ncbi:Phenazine biosynthesis PhzC/PhzF protein [Alloactinosynnema sp. L-07]|uniref:PhzF family phenazine biosynthesis protein n=1 Tax=Alloactinosynnema sp. L-07 TaxID=1653480 RepID=UPI00065EFF9B|nr:PhzF family phenazine biosynthesis protein [Alloactinosynnema sp. L-07]CRK57278.1 Phenazine biosynthesis PhzC/PhzF protein [Alloactinosynnema sp. L-07]
MTEVAVLRVFADAHGEFGNFLGVVLDGPSVPEEERIELAARVGYSATVFVDDVRTAAMRIYTPKVELPFAGHPVIGTAWYLARETGTAPTTMRPQGGDAPTWTEDGRTWITAGLAATPPWWHERLAHAADVDALVGPIDPAQDCTQLWAWEDETLGHARARVFASRIGVTEDEACGSASMRLAAVLGRDLTVRHGHGSVIRVRPGAKAGTADLGGLVVADPPRRL